MLTEDQERAIEDLCRPYKSHLSFAQLSEGIGLCLMNARSLYEDAAIFIENGRYARGMSLLVSCLEELGKVHVLASMARIPRTNQRLWAEAWKSFRSHEHKATIAIVDTYPDEARGDIALILWAAMWQWKIAPAAERIRQYGLYVDFHATEKRWLSPSEVTVNDVRRWTVWVESALPKLEGAWQIGLFSEAALRLQNEILGPLNEDRPKAAEITPAQAKDTLRKAPSAMREYYRRLVSERIIPEDADIQVAGIPLADFVRVA